MLALVRAFQLAGSREIFASLWQVDDERCAELMGRLHRRLVAGAPTAEALAEAARALRKDGFVHPFYWGAFVLYGAG